MNNGWRDDLLGIVGAAVFIGLLLGLLVLLQLTGYLAGIR